MQITYSEIDNLEEIATDASSTIKKDEWSYNHILAYEFAVHTVLNSQLADVTNDAKLWAQEKCPTELYINHGSFIGDGMDHIIKELKKKPSSNRALFSLISQKDISYSEDAPIPSFMIYQTCIDSNILYCTAYFRALEVSTFLRINIEELRLKLAKLCENIHGFNKIRLVIFAFRGYNDPCINTLKKAKLDLMSAIEIYKTLEKTPYQLHPLIKEKAKNSTIIELKSITYLKESLENIEMDIQCLNKKYVMSLLNDSLMYGQALKEIRTKESHHNILIDTTRDNFLESLNKLACEFEKCH